MRDPDEELDELMLLSTSDLIVREAYEGLQERFGRPADEARQIVAERFQLSPTQAERVFSGE